MVWDSINRRRFVRIIFPFTTHIYPSQKEAITTYTENISIGGIKVTIKRELAVSSIVDLKVYLRKEPITCKGKIAWVKKRESEYLEEDNVFFDIGIEFQDIKEEDKIIIKDRIDELRKKGIE